MSKIKREVVDVFGKLTVMSEREFVDYIVGLSDEDLNGVIKKYMCRSMPDDRTGRNEVVLKEIQDTMNIGYVFNDRIKKTNFMEYYNNKYKK